MPSMTDIREKELQRQVREEMHKCVHFNGIVNDECDAGINYRQLMGDGIGCFAHMPCFRDEAASVTCNKAAFPSEQEARAEVDEREKRVKEFIQQLNDGICPTCKVKVQQRQVGPCVYGTCGHRLYQGKVNPAFADKGKRIHSTRKL